MWGFKVEKFGSNLLIWNSLNFKKFFLPWIFGVSIETDTTLRFTGDLWDYQLALSSPAALIGKIVSAAIDFLANVSEDNSSLYLLNSSYYCWFLTLPKIELTVTLLDPIFGMREL